MLSTDKELLETLETPEFESEGEEADWWDARRDVTADEFVSAAAAGKLGVGTVAKRAGALPTTTIRLAPEDIALAKAQAARIGMRYQTYLKVLLHRALRAGDDPLKPILQAAVTESIAAAE